MPSGFPGPGNTGKEGPDIRKRKRYNTHIGTGGAAKANPGGAAAEVPMTPQAATSPAVPSDTVNSYRVEERLGSGGMGLVYRALDTRLDRQVALKFLPWEVGFDEAPRAALRAEARAASALDHPNIGVIHGIEETLDGQQFIVMAYYEGQTLAQKLRHGPLPPKEAAEIALQVANGLAEAHAHHIVHRDIKPSNIFLTRQRLVKILDFGVARVIQSERSTRSVQIAGTAAYMSPEQVHGSFLDARTDLWSLGTVLYEMVTGHGPFSSSDLASTLFAVVNAPAPDLGDEVPRTLQKIVYRALAKQPEDRYQSATEMIPELRQVSAGAEHFVSDATLTMEKKAAHPAPERGMWRYFRWVLALLAVLIPSATVLNARLPHLPRKAAYQSYLEARRYMQRYEKTEKP